ncbi:arginyltransferase [Chromatiales bacterium (ex Bugula neritina AB1)]|nr:arginyltransferase [Chromatiales bacterium (ex Bugula neritina AB1)]
MKHSSKIVLFQSAAEACSYLDNHSARNIYADPFRPPTMDMYNLLIQKGFRRSGHHIYRPHCDSCDKCVSVRIPVDTFKPTRSQKRSYLSNNDLSIHLSQARYTDEIFNLYTRYLNRRHQNAGMDNPTREDFERFLISDWCDTLFFELRLNGELICVAVTDELSTGLSAVYTFFDPDLTTRSLGTAAIVFQVELARQKRLPFVYLGYWIDGSQKMMYKAKFKPQQRYIADNWIGS